MNNKEINQQDISNHAKSYGFIYPSSSIYNGLANAWDYGPLGTLLKNNIKNLWTNFFVTTQKDMVLIDTPILLNPNVWKASGHISNFSDPLIDCKECKNRFRADKLIETFDPTIQVTEATSNDELEKIINEKAIACPTCKSTNWTSIRKFNLMYKTFQGVTEDKASELYLRPETAQGIFINFSNILRTTRKKLPFGVGQIGKAFRNEITPGNFIFRVREFEQMEIEHFCFPDQADDIFEQYRNKINTFLLKYIGLNEQNLRVQEHKKEELAHYAKRTIDFQYNFCHGWAELWGLANRSNFDLRSHQNASGQSLTYHDAMTNQKILPCVIEPSVGVDRLFYAILIDAYKKEKTENGDEREVLALTYNLAPYKIAVLPLVNKLSEEANIIFDNLIKQGTSCTFDASGSIGKRYRRQDAIGTYYCITFDFESLDDECVTIRHRDTMKQERIKIKQINEYILNNR